MSRLDALTAIDDRRRQQLRRAAGVLGVLLLVGLVVPFVVYAVPQVAGADHGYVVLSGSMEPSFGPGDVIIVDSVPEESITAGDVITFSRSGESRPTTHRVTEVVETENGLAFRTAGDANEEADPSLVHGRQVHGEVMTVGGHLVVFPLAGYVIRFTQTPLGFAAFVLVPLAVLVLTEAYSLVGGSRGRTSESRATATGVGAASATAEPATTEAETTQSAAEADTGTAGEADDEATAITLTTRDLRAATAVLVPFTAYAVWVAAALPTTWSITAAASVGAALLLVGGMYCFGGADATAEPDGAASGPAGTTGGGRSRPSVADGGPGHGGTDAPGVGSGGRPGAASKRSADPAAAPPASSAAPSADRATNGAPGTDADAPTPAVQAVAASDADSRTASEAPAGTSEDPTGAAEPDDGERAAGGDPQGADAGGDGARDADGEADAEADAGDDGDPGTRRRAAPENRALYLAHLPLYYLGYAVVAPLLAGYRRVAGSGGGERDD